ncbi:MAG: hypothetical protein KJP05_07190 [Deltaproteobacteria bacterium]|nr:hypothetical protein [Deltaproteobacteria bacterium]
MGTPKDGAKGDISFISDIFIPEIFLTVLVSALLYIVVCHHDKVKEVSRTSRFIVTITLPLSFIILWFYFHDDIVILGKVLMSFFALLMGLLVNFTLEFYIDSDKKEKVIEKSEVREKHKNEFLTAFLGHDWMFSDNEREPSRSIYIDQYRFLSESAQNDEFWINRIVFDKVWSLLINRMDAYYSISDFSIYSDTPATLRDRSFWRERIRSEIGKLKENKLLIPGAFKKIIVYKACEIRDENATDVSCKKGESCNHIDCTYESCIVKIAFIEWENGIKHNSPDEEHEGDFLLLKKREEITGKFEAVNALLDEGVAIGSLDIGLFGEDYVGEEYKYNPDFSSEATSYLYRFRKDKDIVQKVRRIVFDDDRLQASIYPSHPPASMPE